jgi:hypothetical protein
MGKCRLALLRRLPVSFFLDFEQHFERFRFRGKL